MASWFRRYLLPGFVFQSITIAGGYGTGRELAEFFLRFGPLGGLLGLLLPTTLVISTCCVVAFELARRTRTYDYRSFLRQLLGRGWFLYEIAYLATVLLVLAVIGAATGSVVSETFGIPAAAGTLLLLVAIAYLAFQGSRVIEGFLSIWSFVLYAVYIAVFAFSLLRFGPAIRETLADARVIDGWFLSGLRYGSLQLGLVPAILFSTSHIRRRREAFVAGALVGPIMVAPAALFLFSMLAHYPMILERPVPVNHILQALDSRLLQIGFQIVLIGTFIETGTGLIHAFNERLANGLAAIGRSMPGSLRPFSAVVLIIAALAMSRVGLIDLIAVGYGALTWVFMAVLVLPLLTIGIRKIAR